MSDKDLEMLKHENEVRERNARWIVALLLLVPVNAIGIWQSILNKGIPQDWYWSFMVLEAIVGLSYLFPHLNDVLKEWLRKKLGLESKKSEVVYNLTEK